jgi:hypothetical protein
MRAGAVDDRVACPLDAWLSEYGGGVGAGNAGLPQRFSRKVEAPEFRIFVEVAQDVGQLQGASQLICKRAAQVLRQAKHFDRKAPYSACYAVAVKLERGVIRRPDVGDNVHFHAVNHGQKVFASQPKCLDRSGEPLKRRNMRAVIERRDIAPPGLQLRDPLRARTGTVSDVVDRPAERVNFEHRIALLRWQDAHRRIERASGRPRHRCTRTQCGCCRTHRLRTT